MSIKKLLIIGFSIATALSLLTGIIGYTSALNSTEEIKQLVHNDMALREVSLELNVSLLLPRRYEKDIFLNIGNPEKQQKYLNKLNGTSDKMHKDITKLQAIADGIPELRATEKSKIREFDDIFETYLHGANKVAQEAISGSITPSEANEKMKPYKNTLGKMESALTALSHTSHTILVERGQDVITELHYSEIYLMIACAVAAIFSLSCALFIFRSIHTPITSLITFANKIAEGDLDAKPTTKFTGEMHELHHALEAMVHELKDKLGFTQGILDAIPTPCAMVSRDEKVSWLNQELIDMLEYSGTPKAFINEPFSKLCCSGDTQNTPSMQAIVNRKTMQKSYHFTLPSGTTLYLDAKATPVTDHDDNVTGSVSFWYNLTEFQQQKEIIEEQNKRISEAAHEAIHIADQVAAEAGELEKQISTTSQGANIQTERMGETAAAVEEMNATTLEVANNAALAATEAEQAQTTAANGAQIVQEVVQTTEEVQQYAEAMRTTISELGTQAQDVGNIINVINDIADQTNLLALNAAIEAARAGEAGRGFAVVADEVRKLAEKTMQATSEVENVIRGIQQSSGATLTQMEQVATHIEHNTTLTLNAGSALEQIVETGEKTADRVRSIAAASEEQSAVSEQIARATDEVNALTQEAAQGMQEADRAVATLSSLSRNLEEIIRKIQE